MHRFMTFHRLFVHILCLMLILSCFGDDNVTNLSLNEHHPNNSTYNNYDYITRLFQHYESRFPQIARRFSLGQSNGQRELWGIQISDGVVYDEPGEPKVKLVANIHGNEVVGRQMLIYLSSHLLENYGTDNHVTTLVNNTNIFILPSANPDGFAMAEEGQCKGDGGRGNQNYVDLDENFPDQFKSIDLGMDPIQVETRAIMDWIANNSFVLSAGFHDGNVVATYPFDDSVKHQTTGFNSVSPDDAVFQHLAQTYADTHHTMHEGENCGQKVPGGFSNGAELFEVTGGMQDYNYLHSNCFEITLSLSCCKYPKAEELSKEWDNNKDALIQFLEQAQKGIQGFVTDTDTGIPIQGAVISVKGIKKKKVPTATLR